MPFKTFTPDDLLLRERHQLFIGGIAPRPIAFVGSVSAAGAVNLAPYSFFNAFGSNPTYVGVSPAISARTGKPKDTLVNIKATGEFTVSIVSYAMVQQMHLASGEFPPEVNEFDVCGLTELPSEKIAPPGVAESPFVMECRLEQHIELGGEGASGNLLLGRVVTMRVKEEMLDDQGRIDPYKMDQVARLGYGWYTRAREGLFEVAKRQGETSVGWQALPEDLKTSTVLTANDLARLAGVLKVPDTIDADPELIESYGQMSREQQHGIIKALIGEGKLDEAWGLALKIDD